MSSKEVIIRNYQGKLPAGIWACSECQFRSKDLQEAAAHADEPIPPNGHWVWLFAELRTGQPALFEMHESDMGGVYLNSVRRGVFYRGAFS